MSCPHDIVERDIAVSADGYCPLCQAAEIERLRELKTPATRQLLNITKALLDDANAEIARLRAALESVAYSYDLIDAVEYARKALANEERQ